MIDPARHAKVAAWRWLERSRPVLVAIVCLCLGPCVTRSPESEQAAKEALVRAGNEVWLQGRGSGVSLRLQKDGRYVADVYCDICSPDPRQGRWARKDGVLTLSPDAGAPPHTMVVIVFNGCPGLVFDDRPPPRYPGDVFFARNDPCSNAL